jgi:hypothetical protein
MAIPGNELFDGVFVARRECADASALSTVVFDCSSSGTVRLAQRLADSWVCFLTGIESGSFHRLPMLRQTSVPNSRNSYANSLAQVGLLFFDDTGLHNIKRPRSPFSMRFAAVKIICDLPFVFFRLPWRPQCYSDLFSIRGLLRAGRGEAMLLFLERPRRPKRARQSSQSDVIAPGRVCALKTSA